MGFISDEDQKSLRDLFEKNLESDVEIVLFTEKPSLIVIPGKEECLACEETEQLLGEVTSLSEKLKLTVNYMPEAAEQAAGMGSEIRRPRCSENNNQRRHGVLRRIT